MGEGQRAEAKVEQPLTVMQPNFGDVSIINDNGTLDRLDDSE